MKQYTKIDNAFTHGGIFHADDVFATALLQYLYPDIKIYRGYQVPENFDGIVYDIGFGKYDHHQADRRIRENGIPYAAFGLLWEAFGSEILGEKEAARFDEEFVQPIDLADNTGKEYILSKLIADRNPSWKEQDIDNEKCFYEAVAFAKEILEHRFAQILAEKEAYEIVRNCAKNAKNRILYLKQMMPWKEAVKEFDILYVIYPSIRGGYNIQAVLKNESECELRRPFPETWRGKRQEVLEEITGIEGITFCHLTGFLAATNTLEQAYEIAELAMNG